MKRTQFNLDEKTYFQLASYARKEKTSLSEAVRQIINKQAEESKVSSKKNHPLLGLIEIGKKYPSTGPHDLSANMDYYLYGPGSPEFGYPCKTKKKK